MNKQVNGWRLIRSANDLALNRASNARIPRKYRQAADEGIHPVSGK
jgi:hypothetical protein